jgi:hypothetical protein
MGETKPDSVTFMGATPEQVATLADHVGRYGQIGWLRRRGDALLIADLAVYQVAGSTLTGPGQQRKAYDYAHALRRELAERKLLPVPDMRIPRCGVCKHGTERLFRAGPETHRITTGAGLCVRCWSDLHNDNEEEIK